MATILHYKRKVRYYGVDGIGRRYTIGDVPIEDTLKEGNQYRKGLGNSPSGEYAYV
jgi:hypothetical protein